MSVLARGLPFAAVGAWVLYSYRHNNVCPQQQNQQQCNQRKRQTVFLPLSSQLPPPFLSCDPRLLFSITCLESNNNTSNESIDQNSNIIEKSKANFLELQDQLFRSILTRFPLVENFQNMTAADLRESLANLWDNMTLNDIIDSVKDVKDTVANPELNQDAVVRQGRHLCHQENVFLQKRMEFQRSSFAKFIGVDEKEVELEDIPVIAVASSGGGYRAMLGLAGYLKAMKDSGALDCITYIAGISGSCWALSLYYSVLTNCNSDTLISHLKSRVGSHIGSVSHVLSLAAASTQNAKLLIQGIGQRYLQQSTVNLVDLFGTLIGATLFTRTAIEKDDDDGDQHEVEFLLNKTDMKLSSQRQFFENGSQPMPIYCVVRQDLGLESKSVDQWNSTNDENVTLEQPQEDDIITSEIEEEGLHTYQWFELSAYEFGSDEIHAFVPMYAFGRKFVGGKCTERLPEQRLDSLLGMFGSAFAASVVHFYQEIRSFLPISTLHMTDETIGRYQKSLSIYHPISPAVYANPFYQLSKTKDTTKKSQALFNSEMLHLMDAGMDNNIPFFPLINERKADIVVAVDMSADIQTAPHFDHAEEYVKRHGIEGWPVGAGWPKEDIKKTIKETEQTINSLDRQQHRLDHDNNEEYQTSSNKSQNDVQSNMRQRYALGPCTVFPTTTTTYSGMDDGKRLIILIYFPFIGNDDYDPDFDPQTADFCSTWNFVYEPDQVDKVVGLAQANWNNNTDVVRTVFKAVWERKRRLRLERRDADTLANIFLFP